MTISNDWMGTRVALVIDGTVADFQCQASRSLAISGTLKDIEGDSLLLKDADVPHLFGGSMRFPEMSVSMDAIILIGPYPSKT